LFIGAAFGGAFGVMANMIFPATSAPYPAYALVGMAAVFSAVSRASLTSIVMLFEMTRNYNIILPLMFACVVADVAAWLLYPDTIYTRKLVRRGVRIDQDLGFNVLKTRFVADAMTRAVETVPQDLPVEEVQDKILKTGHQGFPVVDENGRLLGIITGRDVMKAMEKDPKLPAITVAHHRLAVAYPDETLDDVWKRMGELGIGRLPVVLRSDPSKLVGIITKGDIARFARAV
ncbi:CBS domain-containing protein, partial [Candidatus Bipolaricaulota bacterium]|nr:CBS domain-containing protein [Candidatus Bipolaricaulota bacterium]